jgi:hypothetical protein
MMHAKATPAAPIVAQVELVPGLQVKATLTPARGEDLRPAICALLDQGPKTTPELQAALRVNVNRIFYYLDPLAFRLKLIVCKPSTRRGQPNRWSLAVPLSQALDMLAQDDHAAQLAQRQAQGRAHLQAQAQERLQAKQEARAAKEAKKAPAPAPQEPQLQQPQPQPTPSKPAPKETRPPAPKRGTRQDNKNLDRLAARRAEVAQLVRSLLEIHGPMAFGRVVEALGRAGQRVNESRLRDRIAGQEATMAEAGVRYMARMGAWAVVYLPSQQQQAEALGKHLDKTPLRRRTAQWTPNPWARTAPQLSSDSAPSPAQAPQADPDRKSPLLTSATLDPRREPPLVLPGAPPLSPVAARAAAERLAKRATVHGLTWTYRPVVGLSGVWEIVESQRQEDHRLMGGDICERRLQRWARENFCPPRIDTPNSTNPQRQEVQP